MFYFVITNVLVSLSVLLRKIENTDGNFRE